jgi:predicted amidohydrolase
MSAVPDLSSVRVAVAQTAPTVGDVDANLSDARARIDSLAGRADVVVFPELFTTGYRRAGIDHLGLAESIPGGRSLATLADAAASAHLAVVGTILEREGETVYDTAIVLDARGQLVGRYRKSHLYPAERAYFGQGDEMIVARADGELRIGLAICFEHAFPEVFTELALAGANLVAIPSAVPVGYEHLLELRTRARAQDNQLFVAAANLVGFDGETQWCGGSVIVDPRGTVLAGAGSDPGEIVAIVDLAEIATERKQEPALANRRPELYRHLAR